MSGPGDARRPVSSGSGAPPPRRSAALDVGSPEGPAAAPPPRRPTIVAPPAPSPGPARRVETAEPPVADVAPRRRARAPWWLRIVAWLIAVPVGLALVGIPARRLGYLDSQKLLDVLIGEDTDRYLPLVVIVLLWALVTAILVQLIVEGGAWLRRRRRGAEPSS